METEVAEKFMSTPNEDRLVGLNEEDFDSHALQAASFIMASDLEKIEKERSVAEVTGRDEDVEADEGQGYQEEAGPLSSDSESAEKENSFHGSEGMMEVEDQDGGEIGSENEELLRHDEYQYTKLQNEDVRLGEIDDKFMNHSSEDSATIESQMEMSNRSSDIDCDSSSEMDRLDDSRSGTVVSHADSPSSEVELLPFDKGYTVDKYPCSICGKYLGSANSLANHRRRAHDKYNNYDCQFCDKSFPDSYRLRSHMRVHSGEKPFGCTMCATRFTEKSSATRHMRNVHRIRETEAGGLGVEPGQFVGLSASNIFPSSTSGETEASQDDIESGFNDIGPGVDDIRPGVDEIGPGVDDIGASLDDTGTSLDDKDDSFDDTRGSFDDSESALENTVHSVGESEEKSLANEDLIDNRNFGCRLCDKWFMEIASVRRHLKRFHAIKADQMYIADRRVRKTPRQTCCCKLCGKLFSEKSSVQRHLRRIHGALLGQYDGLYSIIDQQIQFKSFRAAITDSKHEENTLIKKKAPVVAASSSKKPLFRPFESDSDPESETTVGASGQNTEECDNSAAGQQEAETARSEFPGMAGRIMENNVVIKTEPPDSDQEEQPTGRSQNALVVLSKLYTPRPKSGATSADVDSYTKGRNSQSFSVGSKARKRDLAESGSKSSSEEDGWLNSSAEKSERETEKLVDQSVDSDSDTGVRSDDDSEEEDDGNQSDDSDKTVDFDADTFRQRDQGDTSKTGSEPGKVDYSKDIANLDAELRKALMPGVGGSGGTDGKVVVKMEPGLPLDSYDYTGLNSEEQGYRPDSAASGDEVEKMSENSLIMKSKPFIQCNQCDKVYHNWKSYREHRRNKHPLTCELCKKRFSEQKDFDAHMRGHYGLGTGKNYSCPVCGKFIKDASSRAKHMRLHTGEKPYKCEICDKRFTQTGHLQSHMRIHNGERPFDCKLCGKFFSERSSVKRHLRKIHFKDYTKKCENCPVICKTKEEYREHIKIHTPALYSCDLCQKDFPDSKRLKLHKYNAHSKLKSPGLSEFACNLCDKVFFSSKGLRNHTKKHGEGLESDFKCGICEKIFPSAIKLEKHMVTHVEKKYICLTCNKVFRTSAAFSVHKKRHLIEVLQQGDNPDTSTGIQKALEHLGSEPGPENDSSEQKEVHVDEQQKVTLDADQLTVSSSADKDFKMNLTQDSASTEFCVRNPDTLLNYVVGGNIVDGKSKDTSDKGDKSDSKAKQSTGKPVSVNVVHKSRSRQLTVHCCNVCGMYMTSKHHLKRHIDGVHREKSHKCNECGNLFSTLELVRAHRRKCHAKRQSHQCQICLKMFRDKSVMKLHMRLHSDVRPYTCQVCSKGFTTMYALKCHLEIHSGESKKCPKCNTKFLHQKSYEAHVKANCLGRRRRPKKATGNQGQGFGKLRCSLCSRMFTYRESLVFHLQGEHGVTDEDTSKLADSIEESAATGDSAKADDATVKNSESKEEQRGAEKDPLKEFPYIGSESYMGELSPPDDLTASMSGTSAVNNIDGDLGEAGSKPLLGLDTDFGDRLLGEEPDYSFGLDDSLSYNNPSALEELDTFMCMKCGAEFQSEADMQTHKTEGSCSRRRKRAPVRCVPKQNADFLEHLDMNVL